MSVRTAEAEQEITKVRIDIPKPHSEKQDEFVRCNNLRQVIKAGRRFGKTVGAAIKALLAFLGVCSECMGEGCVACDFTGKVRPKRVLYAAPTAEQVGKFWYEVTTALEAGIEAQAFKKDETEHTVEVKGTETRIRAKTAWNANTLRGDFADLLILEEFQLMNEDAWEEVGQPMLLDNNGTAIFIFTPPSLKSEGVSKAKDPRHSSKMYKKALEDTTGKWKAFHFTSYDNPTLSKDALDEISKDMSADAYRREIMAEDDEIETSWLVYGKFDDTICKIKRFEIPEDWPVYVGHDFGQANPGALFVAQVRLPLPPSAPSYLRYGDYVAFAEYAPGAGYSAQQHIDKFRDILGKKDDSSPMLKLARAVGGNVTTEEEIRQLYRGFGWYIEAPEITKVNVQVDRAISLMEQNQLHVFEDLHNFLGQIASCLWIIDPETRKPTNKIKDEAKWHILACFVEGTMIKTDKGDVPIEDIKAGDMALTRKGYRKVMVAGETGVKEVMTAYFSDGTTLTGTPDHPIFVKDKGFVPLRKLRYRDTTVNQPTAEASAKMMKPGSAQSVAKTLDVIDTSPRESAQKPVRFLHAKPQSPAKVYNLSVEDVPEYFANGILVHNCFRYLATILSPKYIPRTGNVGGGYIGGVRVD